MQTPEVSAKFAQLGTLPHPMGPDEFGSYLAMGVTSWIALQALINIGGVTRTIPLTGIPLPFVSYGGSALIMTMAAIGVLLNVSRYTKDQKFIERPERQAKVLRTPSEKLRTRSIPT